MKATIQNVRWTNHYEKFIDALRFHTAVSCKETIYWVRVVSKNYLKKLL